MEVANYSPVASLSCVLFIKSFDKVIYEFSKYEFITVTVTLTKCARGALLQ